MKNRLREELEAMLELHTGDSFTADNVHTLVNGIFAADEGGGFEYVRYDNNAFPYPQIIGSTASSISGLGPADEKMMKTIFIMPNKSTNPDATLMIVVDEVTPETTPKTYQYVYVGNINDLPSDVLTESSIVDIPGTDPKSVMSQKGATDLVSEYNVSTNNNNAEYTFAQAVVLVPASLQKGGLTIKYIDSTTHEYAIRRLMSSTWNTTESNWQGIDEEPTANSNNLVKSGGVKANLDDLNNSKANKDGKYPQLTAGAAENLVGQTVDSEAYLIRPTGGTENEVANGVAYVLGMEGNSCVWNQLMYIDSTTTTGEFQFNATTKECIIKAKSYINSVKSLQKRIAPNAIVGHTYYIKSQLLSGEYSGSIYIQYGGVYGPSLNYDTVITAVNTNTIKYAFGSGGVTVTQDIVFKFILIDLTLLGIGNLTRREVKLWLAQHIETKPNYDYNNGTILSAQTLGIKTYGQNLLNPTTKQAKLIPYTWVENGTTYSNQYTIKNIPSGATATFTPDATGVAETVDVSGGTLDITSYGSGILELSAATANTYVCIKWTGNKDNDVVPYEEHTYDFDVKKVYGKVNGAGEYLQCFLSGMKSAGSVHDTLTASNAVIKATRVDLSTRTIQTRNTGSVNKVISLNLPTPYNKSGVVILSQTYKYAGNVGGISDLSNPDNKEVGLYTYNGGTSASDTILYIVMPVEATLSSNDVIVYSRQNLVTYTDLIYRDGGIDRPLADVLMNINVNNWSMEEQLITPYEDGNPTSISATIKTQYSMDAVEAIDTLQKTCYFADDVKANLQALLTCINTNCASTLGGTFAISETATDKVFAFTFTPNTEPNVEPSNEGE